MVFGNLPDFHAFVLKRTVGKTIALSNNWRQSKEAVSLQALSASCMQPRGQPAASTFIARNHWMAI